MEGFSQPTFCDSLGPLFAPHPYHIGEEERRIICQGDARDDQICGGIKRLAKSPCPEQPSSTNSPSKRKMAIKHFDKPEEFEEIIKTLQQNPVLVYFSGENCGPCLRVAPSFEEYSNEFKIDFYKTERPRKDGYIDIFRKQDPFIQAYPTFIIYYYGIAFGKILAKQPEHLKDWIHLMLNVLGKSELIANKSTE